ncbi:MAG: zinc-dependent peptidase [Gammaproteobacteria bacterium]|nr:zinc-dependent peptidase [Gammaproteobacteria bacterium]MDP2349482.1 zinc-dependent peptidase [Gammaproteobacteria bacterium]
MTLQPIFILIALWSIVVAVTLFLFVYPRYRRRKLDTTPFPPAWLTILRRNLSVYKSMWPDQQEQLRKLIVRFLRGKDFVGCAGQEINDEIRVTIAAQACLLLLNRPSHEYQDLRTILVYPSGFMVNRDHHDEFGLVTEQKRFLSGESWSNGKVILAWDSVERGIRNFRDGENVVLHEFAHQLDHESGITNGAPLLYSKGSYSKWARIFSEEFSALQKASDEERATLIDQYGATDPAEFFAVVTETFYERPHEMAHEHAELFEELKAYYRVDPREWQHKPPLS